MSERTTSEGKKIGLPVSGMTQSRGMVDTGNAGGGKGHASRARWNVIRHAGHMTNALTYNRPLLADYKQTQNTDSIPRRGGINVFSINKRGMTRAVRAFSEKPPPCPFTVCFYFPSTALTHKDVLKAIKEKIYYLENAVVTRLQFEELNVIYGARGLENRWLITLNQIEARDELLKIGLYLYGRRVRVQRYDDILKEEWEECLKYRQIQRALNLAQAQKEVKEDYGSDAHESGPEPEPETQISGNVSFGEET